MRSSGGEQRESREKRDGELERMFSLAARDQDGLMAPSLKARGLAMDDLEDELWRWMLLTNGRTVNPPGGRNQNWGVSLQLVPSFSLAASLGQSRKIP